MILNNNKKKFCQPFCFINLTISSRVFSEQVVNCSGTKIMDSSQTTNARAKNAKIEVKHGTVVNFSESWDYKSHRE